MGESFVQYYKFRELAEKKKIPVFLHCLDGYWACQIGYNFKDSGVDRVITKAMKQAIEIYEKNLGK